MLADTSKKELNMQFMQTSHLTTPHGFSTRLGGQSEGIYASFNLGLSTGEDARIVAKNRQQVFDAFGVTKAQVCGLHQVHSATVVEAKPTWFEIEADASVTNNPELLLVIGTADCLPILFHDPINKAIGAAHAGWRGSAQGIAKHTVVKMQQLYGTNPADLEVAIGPCIKGACYQVGQDVINEFQEAGFPTSIYQTDHEGRYRLDLDAANRYLLEGLGVTKIHNLDACTHCDETQFYSHRRDARKRGSHWSAIKLATN